ncbi:MAG: RNA polymerase-binding protein DksA [Caldimonas sp.]
MSTSAVRKTPQKTSASIKKVPPAKKAALKKAAPATPSHGRSTVPAKKTSPAPTRPAAHAPPAQKVPLPNTVPKKTPDAKPAPAPKKSVATKAPAELHPVSEAPKPAPAPAAAKKAVPAKPPAVAKVVQPAPPPVVMPPGVIPRKPGRGTPKYFVAPVQAPLPAPTSRFADRFAPPRPPTRQMNKPEDNLPRAAHKADPKLANAWKTKTGRELSDDEIMAMPEAEYMSDKQLEFFRMKLQTLKDDLLSNAGETTEHLREDTSIVPDPADRATIEEEHALELRTRDRERKLLKKISQSLGRIESGEYGFCDETGEPIGLGRLIARPTATLSLEAQQRRELKQKMFGD